MAMNPIDAVSAYKKSDDLFDGGVGATPSAGGEEFGKIAIEKGLATTEDINQALELQRKVFKKSRHKILIGYILVETRILTI